MDEAAKSLGRKRPSVQAAMAALVELRPLMADARTRALFDGLMTRILDDCVDMATAYWIHKAPDEVPKRVRAMAPVLAEAFQPWTLEICFLLDQHGVLRYGQLRSRLPGISTRTLSAKLRRLKELGLVQRRVIMDAPPHVDYEISARGRQTVLLCMPLFIHLVSPFMEGGPEPDAGVPPPPSGSPPG